MRIKDSRETKRQRGHAVMEVALLSPWIFFLFAGALDMGFYAHALIATENAARVGVEYTSKSSTTLADSATACQYALVELKAMSNVRTLSNCNSSPLTVTAASTSGPDGATASAVTVVYRTVLLIPIPGVMSQATITRTVTMRLKNS